MAREKLDAKDKEIVAAIAREIRNHPAMFAKGWVKLLVPAVMRAGWDPVPTAKERDLIAEMAAELEKHDRKAARLIYDTFKLDIKAGYIHMEEAVRMAEQAAEVYRQQLIDNDIKPRVV